MDYYTQKKENLIICCFSSVLCKTMLDFIHSMALPVTFYMYTHTHRIEAIKFEYRIFRRYNDLIDVCGHFLQRALKEILSLKVVITILKKDNEEMSKYQLL